jgi:hypothetical protein
MSWYLPGVPSVTSTAGTATNPTTAVILAQITSTGPSSNGGLNSSMVQQTQIAGYFYLGTSTQATEWWIEHCLSTGTGSTALRGNGFQGRTVVVTASGQTSQFVQRFDLTKGDFVRVRIAAAFTGTANAKIQAEVIS